MTHLDPYKQSRLAMMAKQGDTQAKERLMTSNQALVAHWAHRFKGRGLEIEELMQEGQAGMIKAIDRFEPGRKASFATYASLWIRQAMGRACEKQGSLNRFGVKLPSEVCSAFSHIDNPQRDDFAAQQARRMQKLGSPAELSAALTAQAQVEITPQLIRAIFRQSCGHMQDDFAPHMLCLHGFQITERAFTGQLSPHEWFLVSRLHGERWCLEVMVAEEWLPLSRAVTRLSEPGIESLLKLADDLALMPADSCPHCAVA